MEHVVFYPGPDAAPAFCRFGSLEEAVRFVEHLRNTEGVSEVSVHTLSPVPLAFRAYYRVEVPAGEVAEAGVPEQTMPEQLVPEQVVPVEPVEPLPVDGVPVDELPMPVDEAAVPVDEVPMPELVEAAVAPVEGDVVVEGGHRSLGFFAH